MRISKFSIDGFGLFDGPFELALPEGVALILGDNETGKSTIFSAIGAILFGLTESERAFFAPHGAASPRSGSLEIEAHGKCYRLSRDFAPNRAKIEQLGEPGRVLFEGSAKRSGRTDEKEAYDEWMRKLFGLETLDLFLNSVFIEQSGLPAEMEVVVRRIVSGTASADYAVALDNLKETCETLTMAVPWKKKRKVGQIEILETELQERKRILFENRAATEGIEESKERLLAAESQLRKIGESLENNKALEQDLAAFTAGLEQKRQIEKQLNDCRKDKDEIGKLRYDIARFNEKIRIDYPQYATLPEQAEAELASLAGLKQTESELGERYRQTERDIPQLRFPRFAIAAFIAGILIAGLGAAFLGGILKVGALLLGIILCASPLIYAILSVRSQKSAHDGKLGEIKRQLDLLKAQSAGMGKRYPALAGANLTDVLKNLHDFKHLQNEKEKREEALKHYPSLDEAESKYNSLSNELLVVSKKLDSLKAQRPSLADIEQSARAGKALEETKAETMRLEKRLKELTSERDTLKYRLAAAEARETISEEALGEEIAERQTELGRLKLSREAHLTAIRVLDESISEFHSSHLARIEEKASEYLTRITGGQCRVRLNEQLEPLDIEEDGQHFTPEQLSQGVRDQFYFALRLAAIEQVCGEIRLPILLDDPFVNFDENRLNTTLQMLETLSKSHQIVLLTHDRRYADWKIPACLLGKSHRGMQAQGL